MKENVRLPSAVYVVPWHQVVEGLHTLFKEYMIKPKQQDLLDRMLSPAEVSKLFSPPVHVATISNWNKKGLLTKYYIGRKTYYKYGEVIGAMKSLRKYARN